MPLLCRLFNTILSTGIYPDEWCKAIIITIHKAGDINDCSNYRGISLLSNVGKLFCKIVNSRLTKWAEENDLMYEEQAGFTKGKSTIDQVFILQTIIQKYLDKKKGRCYNVFIDFSKAFDSIPHSHLFYLLCQNGAHSRVLKVMQNMYSKLQSCVKNGMYLSDMFECTVGTRQGCMISPFLFTFYLNELIRMCENCPGVYIDDVNSNVNMLLYADDIVIIGDQVNRVNRLLRVLKLYCEKWGLKVNLDKTKAMIYRKGGTIKKNEIFRYGDTKIENVTNYRYLGVTMSTRLSWSPAQKHVAAQAERACFAPYNVLYKCNFPVKLGLELFKKCVTPILTYGAEIFGTCVHDCLEVCQSKYLRRLLGVGRNTQTDALRGECGQHRIYVSCVVKTIKYWLRLLSKEEGSLLNSCYKLLYRKCERGEQNWMTSVKQLLQM